MGHRSLLCYCIMGYCAFKVTCSSNLLIRVPFIYTSLTSGLKERRISRYLIRGTASKCLPNSRLPSCSHYLCLSINGHCRAFSIKREPSTLQLLGVLYYHNKQLKEAELAWKQALELDPSNLDTRSNYVSTLTCSWLMAVISTKISTCTAGLRRYLNN